MNVPSAPKVTTRDIRDSLPSIAREGSARTLFGRMLDEQIAPVLLEWGFERDGDVFSYPSSVWFLRLGFDSSRLGTMAWHRFMVDVLAISRGAWQEWGRSDVNLPEVPDPRVYYAHDFVPAGGLAVRLEELRGGDGDHAWTVRRDTDPSVIAADVLSAVRRYVLPQFRGRSEASVPPG